MLLGRRPWPFAEVASSADFAGVASSANFDGMAFPAVAGVASLVDLAGMAFPAVVGVMSPAELAGMALPAIAGVAPPAECSRPWRERHPWSLRWHPRPIRWSRRALPVCVTMPDVVVFQENIELGIPTVAMQPIIRDGMTDTEDRHRDRDVGSTEGQAGIYMGREEQQLPRDNNEAIVVGAVGSGAPWFLTGWAGGF